MNDIDNMLRRIAKELEISKTEFDKAVQSYRAVGTYLDNNIPELIRFIYCWICK